MRLAVDRTTSGIFRYLKGDYFGAIQLYGEAIRMLRGITPPPAPLLVETSREIGLAKFRCGKFLNALQLLWKSMAMEENITPKFTNARTVWYSGTVYHEMGEYEKALKEYQTAIAPSEQASRMMIHDSIASIAEVFYDQGDYDAAITRVPALSGGSERQI